MTLTADGTLARTMRVLSCFSDDEPALLAAEIGARTGLPVSTLHRLLARLVTLGLLARAPGRRFTIGSRMFELGELSPLSLRLRETALPHLTKLYEATGENVHLAVLDATSPRDAVALYVARVTGPTSIATLGRMGGRNPLHTTGVGKALLATRDDEWLSVYLEHPLERETVHSIDSSAELLADIDKTRQRGFAVTREEMTLGNVSVATALPTIEGLPPTALGVVVHVERADERRLAPLVIQAARALARDLQHG
ncbi:MAG: IclR family transcriptional regulator [Subtercola sp.]|nr:IclR family transcriptional regulator [Subtercola sp.]